jgi:hypothetical protein
MQAAWVAWYRRQAAAFDAMAHRLVADAEFTHALYARQESKRWESIAKLVENL